MSTNSFGRQLPNTNLRVVSDLSRFEFESPTPRNRSRNTTPTSLDEQPSVIDMDHVFGRTKSMNELNPHFFENDVEVPDPGPKRMTLLEIAEAHHTLPKVRHQPSDTIDYSDIYQYYEKSTTSLADGSAGNKQFAPYPESIRGLNIDHMDVPTISDGVTTMKTPITNQTSMMPSTTLTNFSNYYKSKELPPVGSPEPVFKDHSTSSVYEGDIASMTSQQKAVENVLVKSVMNRPILTFRTRNLIREDGEDQEIIITINFILYLFEVIIAIIVITLSSILVNKDHHISTNIYRYFIADGCISLIVALLFLTTIVNFERRNGSFYVTATMIISMISFIITLYNVIPNKTCVNNSVCSMRRANSAFIVISAFLWLCDLVMFLTTLYISRLNLLEELNFDYSKKGFQSSSSETSSYRNYGNQDSEGLRQYLLTDNGMVEVDEHTDLANKEKIIVYTV